MKHLKDRSAGQNGISTRLSEGLLSNVPVTV
jgi:hypothetical protein